MHEIMFFLVLRKNEAEKNNGPVFVFLKKPDLWKNSSMIVRIGFYSPILHKSKNSFWLFLPGRQNYRIFAYSTLPTFHRTD